MNEKSSDPVTSGVGVHLSPPTSERPPLRRCRSARDDDPADSADDSRTPPCSHRRGGRPRQRQVVSRGDRGPRAHRSERCRARPLAGMIAGELKSPRPRSMADADHRGSVALTLRLTIVWIAMTNCAAAMVGSVARWALRRRGRQCRRKVAVHVSLAAKEALARRESSDGAARSIVHAVDRVHGKALEQPLLDHDPAAAELLPPPAERRNAPGRRNLGVRRDSALPRAASRYGRRDRRRAFAWNGRAMRAPGGSSMCRASRSARRASRVGPVAAREPFPRPRSWRGLRRRQSHSREACRRRCRRCAVSSNAVSGWRWMSRRMLAISSGS